MKKIVGSFAFSLVLAACTSQPTSADRSPCFEQADCEDDCTNIATAENATLVSFVCKPDLCSCGLVVEESCFAVGGVVGNVAIECPADAARVEQQVDATIEKYSTQ